MAMTHVAILVALIGAALLVTGTVLLFGPWAMVADGALLSPPVSSPTGRRARDEPYPPARRLGREPRRARWPSATT
jgi:hypothetical protein